MDNLTFSKKRKKEKNLYVHTSTYKLSGVTGREIVTHGDNGMNMYNGSRGPLDKQRRVSLVDGRLCMVFARLMGRALCERPSLTPHLIPVLGSTSRPLQLAPPPLMSR